MGSPETAADLPGGREAALDLLNEYTKKPGLVKHALAVEAACRAYAEKQGADPDAWGLVGLLHDFDYERWPTPEDHPFRGSEILAEKGYPEWFRRAILSHADYMDVPRESPLERTLYACDELCGFLTACALVTPDRRIDQVKTKSVKKKRPQKEEDLKYIYYFYRPQLVESLWKWDLEDGDNEAEVRKPVK